jgi:phage-related protein
MEKYPPSIPKDMELLVKPSVDNDKMGRGYQRYATTKLAITTWMYALNEHLTKASPYKL